MRILLIDDSPMQQKIAKIYLEKGASHTLVTANNGEEGLKAALSQKFDLVLLDYEMPVMNGEETLKAMKNNPSLKGIPVIICSSSADDEIDRLLSLGAVSFIKKPHGFSTLNEKINSLLSHAI